jgi:hypothetical protein
MREKSGGSKCARCTCAITRCTKPSPSRTPKHLGHVDPVRHQEFLKKLGHPTSKKAVKPRRGCLIFARATRWTLRPSIADGLNARGITVPHGGHWYSKSVSNLLARA